MATAINRATAHRAALPKPSARCADALPPRVLNALLPLQRALATVIRDNWSHASYPALADLVLDTVCEHLRRSGDEELDPRLSAALDDFLSFEFREGDADQAREVEPEILGEQLSLVHEAEPVYATPAAVEPVPVLELAPVPTVPGQEVIDYLRHRCNGLSPNEALANVNGRLIRNQRGEPLTVAQANHANREEHAIIIDRHPAMAADLVARLGRSL